MARGRSAEHELFRHVFEANRAATHHRSLHGGYGYQRILGLDLVRHCLLLVERSDKTVRVLDIGCGDGWALYQLREEIVRRKLDSRFEFYGLGMNRYPAMHIDAKHFIHSGINQLVYDGPPFDLVLSVFTFHYIWHKIEALEKIYNYLLADGGSAYIHFPGFLIRLDGAPQPEVEEGNAAFVKVAESLATAAGKGPLRFRIVPYTSDDDDAVELGSFGVVSMTKNGPWLDCGLLYEGCELVSHRPDSVYVASKYLRSRALFDRTNVEKLTLTRTVTTSTEDVKDYRFNISLDLCIRRYTAPHVVINYPGASRDVDGFHGRFKAVAAELQDRGISGMVRVNNPFIRRVDYPALLMENLRYVIDYVLEHARDICGRSTPDLYLMGHSAGASAIGAVASQYAGIKKILLLAPSLDAGKDDIRRGLRDYRGELYVVVGMDDKIVLPVQSSFFHRVATGASLRKFVALWHCDHDFSGARNYDLLRKAPLWAFFGDKDFPDDSAPVDPQDLIYR